jgi:hypothetical protein
MKRKNNDTENSIYVYGSLTGNQMEFVACYHIKPACKHCILWSGTYKPGNTRPLSGLAPVKTSPHTILPLSRSVPTKINMDRARSILQLLIRYQHATRLQHDRQAYHQWSQITQK